jgi:hypothetical protein
LERRLAGLRLGTRVGLGRLGLRRRLAVLGVLLGTGLGVWLGSLVVRPLRGWPVAGLLLLLLSGLQLRLVRQSAAVPSGFIPEFVPKFVP